MNKIKKLLLGLVTFAAMAVLCAVCAGAQEYTSGLWKYFPQNDGTIYISSYAGFGDDLTIPSTIDGLKVSGIADEAFRGNQNIGKVTLSSNIKFIGYKAFEGSSLTSINIPSSVTEFKSIAGSYAFRNCDSLTTVVFNANTTVPGYAFYDCDSLTTVTIGDTTKGVSFNAFENCSALKTVKLGNNVEFIGEEAFHKTYALQSIVCGSGLTRINKRAFKYSGIKSFAIPPNSHIYWGLCF